MRKHLWVARNSVNRVVEGIAKTGEVSPKGTVAHIEDWDGRVAVEAAPSAMRYVIEPDGRIRRMTFREQVDKGYFVVGVGPTGVKGENDEVRLLPRRPVTHCPLTRNR